MNHNPKNFLQLQEKKFDNIFLIQYLARIGDENTAGNPSPDKLDQLLFQSLAARA